MRTLDQWNRGRFEERRVMRQNAHRSGVLCPKCKKREMTIENPNWVNASDPPSQWVNCRECGHRDLIYY